MSVFRIHRMKQHVRQSFRWAPHSSGVTQIKPKDFEPAGELEAPGFYAAWAQLRENGTPLEVGDALETAAGELRLCKYVGLEEARWILPEVKSAGETADAAAVAN